MEGTDSSRDGMVNRPGDGHTLWSRSSPPGWTESTERSTFTWRKRFQAMAVSTCTWGAWKKWDETCCYFDFPVEDAEHVLLSALSGAWQGRPLVRQWGPNSILELWSLWCFSLNGSGCSSSQWSQNIGPGGPYHKLHQLIASSSLNCHRLVEWGRHNELEASMVGAASSHVLGSLHRVIRHTSDEDQRSRSGWE